MVAAIPFARWKPADAPIIVTRLSRLLPRPGASRPASGEKRSSHSGARLPGSHGCFGQPGRSRAVRHVWASPAANGWRQIAGGASQRRLAVTVTSAGRGIVPSALEDRRGSHGMKRLLREALAGDAESQFNLGVFYVSGQDDNGHAIRGNRANPLNGCYWPRSKDCPGPNQARRNLCRPAE